MASDFARFLFVDGPLSDIKLKVRKSQGKFEGLRGLD
jgi:hypothetical protein